MFSRDLGSASAKGILAHGLFERSKKCPVMGGIPSRALGRESRLTRRVTEGGNGSRDVA